MARAPMKKGAARVKRPRLQKPRSQPTRSGSRSSGDGYEVICSECYTNYQLNTGSSESRITCPECLHAGELAAKDAMTKIAIAKATEKSGLQRAVISAVLFLLVGLTYIGMRSGELSEGANYGFLGACAILLIITLAMTFKYESNRYDVYF